MGIRGRRPDTRLSVVATIPGSGRPEPPGELNSDEAEVWRSIVGSMPDHWFGMETWPLLGDLCAHAAISRQVRMWLREVNWGTWRDDPASFQQAERLTALLRAESQTIASLSVKLRITPSSRYTPVKADSDHRHAAPAKRPWEFVG